MSNEPRAAISAAHVLEMERNANDMMMTYDPVVQFEFYRTAAPILAQALLDALERERRLVKAMVKLGPAVIFNHNIGNWPYWYCLLCGAQNESKSQVEHTPDCAWNIVAATEQEPPHESSR